MSDTVVIDISADGVVSASGVPPEHADHWALLARGLTGYFRARGLVGPEHSQKRLDAFHELLDQYGIDRVGIVSGIVQ